MRDYSKANRKPKPPNDERTAAEIDAKFNADIKRLAALLEWKDTTVAGLIFQSMNNFYWRGSTPDELAAYHLQIQNHFNFMSVPTRRRTFLDDL